MAFPAWWRQQAPPMIALSTGNLLMKPTIPSQAPLAPCHIQCLKAHLGSLLVSMQSCIHQLRHLGQKCHHPVCCLILQKVMIASGFTPYNHHHLHHCLLLRHQATQYQMRNIQMHRSCEGSCNAHSCNTLMSLEQNLKFNGKTPKTPHLWRSFFCCKEC